MARRSLRFGVVGLGAFGETYLACLRGLREALDVEVSAVCSHSAERAQALARQYEVPRWHTDVAALASDPAVDVACIVTVEHEHCRPALACLAAGKDVIVEKPLATRLDEADAMIAAAAGAGRRLLVGQLLRFEVLYRSLAARVHSGELGALASLHTRRNRPATVVARYRRTHPLLETGILDVDAMIWLARSPVRRVRAFTRTINPGPTPDLAWGILEFESGAIGCLETSWLAPERGGIFTDDALSVVGARGTARIDVTRAPLSLWTEDGYLQPGIFYDPIVDGAVLGALREQLIYFTTCLREGREPTRVPLTEVRHGLAVTLALVRSAAEDREWVVQDQPGSGA